MQLVFYIFSAITIIASILPFISHQHWIFRIWEFARIQIVVLQFLTFLFGLIFFGDKSTFFWIIILLHTGLIANHVIILVPYTTLYRKNPAKNTRPTEDLVSIISVNVYQFNQDYDKLIELVKEVEPDILLTMETNLAWEDSLTVLEDQYPNSKKVALENTYGIHFYTKLKVEDIKVNYFVADDLPSIEATLFTKSGQKFTFFGVHPPPPSPTEEETAKERDGELLTIGKKVRGMDEPVVVAGDFNNVAWARSSILFRKTSELIDPRIGRGFVSTYHAKYRLLRFPIDLFFHSTNIFIKDFKTLRNIGSDHLPLFCSFFINPYNKIQEKEIETLEKEDLPLIEEMIEEGVNEQSQRPAVVTA